uniref:Uncharacterized protein n=1 Tax=Sarcophilus harrisii TaxID=9305 RepID=A0A7N4PLE6_SARHA
SVAAGHQPSPGSPGSPRTGTRALVWALLGGGCPPCLLFLLPGINGESHFTDRKAGFLGSHLLRSHRKPQRWLWGLLSSCGPQGAPNTCGGHVLSSPNRGSRAPPLSLIFGALTVGTGFVGVLLGAEIARRFKKLTPTAEPLVCAGSLLAAAPCLFLSVTLAQRTLLEAYTFLALGELLLSFNWAIVTDILLVSQPGLQGLGLGRKEQPGAGVAPLGAGVAPPGAWLAPPGAGVAPPGACRMLALGPGHDATGRGAGLDTALTGHRRPGVPSPPGCYGGRVWGTGVSNPKYPGAPGPSLFHGVSRPSGGSNLPKSRGSHSGRVLGVGGPSPEARPWWAQPMGSLEGVSEEGGVPGAPSQDRNGPGPALVPPPGSAPACLD